MLPVVSMSRPMIDGVGQLELLGELVDDAHVRLVGHEGGEIGCLDPGCLEGLTCDLHHLPDRPAEDRRALLAQRRPRRLAVAEVGERVVHAHGVGLRAVGAPHRRADAGRVARADDHGAGAVAEEERDAAVGGVDDVAELLGADHEGVVRRSAADQGVGLSDAVREAGARGVDVVRGRGVRPDTIGDDRRRPTASAWGC